MSAQEDELLDQVLIAQGGLERWNSFERRAYRRMPEGQADKDALLVAIDLSDIGYT